MSPRFSIVSLMSILCVTSALSSVINTNGNAHLNAENFQDGTHTSVAGKSTETVTLFIIPPPTMEMVASKLTSASFMCPSGYKKDGYICQGRDEASFVSFCSYPSTDANSFNCTTSHNSDNCSVTVRCHSNGNTPGGGGSNSSTHYGSRVTVCPDGFYEEKNKCYKDSVKSAKPFCRLSGWRLGFGGLVCYTK